MISAGSDNAIVIGNDLYNRVLTVNNNYYDFLKAYKEPVQDGALNSQIRP